MHPCWRPAPEPLEVGGPDHRAYVALYLTLLVLLLTRRELVRRRQELVRRLVVAVTVGQQVAMYGYHAHHREGPAESLPLHICRVATLAGLVWLLTDHPWAMDVVFYFGLYAYVSLVYPWGIARTDHAMGWSFAVNHVLTLLLPVLAATTHGWVPTLAGLARAYAAFLVYLAVAERVNRVTGGNYFYLRERPLLVGVPERRSGRVAAAVTLVVFGLGYAASRLVVRRPG
ncbi:TIGR02206 family membrane protein [Ornithinimicrobium cerasi]|uniref:YwaF family protein n=1 Tax=Ornithinimicrobium cerasi TaxID=2248773 RepID=UPI00137B2B14|nr:TIGR02206 family membrane protein [Ornithinimicrobium cerasi]